LLDWQPPRLLQAFATDLSAAKALFEFHQTIRRVLIYGLHNILSLSQELFDSYRSINNGLGKPVSDCLMKLEVSVCEWLPAATCFGPTSARSEGAPFPTIMV
jgi:hypothetical protein